LDFKKTIERHTAAVRWHTVGSSLTGKTINKKRRACLEISGSIQYIGSCNFFTEYKK